MVKTVGLSRSQRLGQKDNKSLAPFKQKEISSSQLQHNPVVEEIKLLASQKLLQFILGISGPTTGDDNIVCICDWLLH